MGKILIYPVHCWHNIDHKEYGEPWVYDLVNQVGLASHTRVNLKYKVQMTINTQIHFNNFNYGKENKTGRETGRFQTGNQW